VSLKGLPEHRFSDCSLDFFLLQLQWSFLCTSRHGGGGITVFPVIADVYTEDFVETVECKRPVGSSVSFVMWTTLLLAKMHHVADCLSGFHCNVAAMTENEGDTATFSLTSVLTEELMSRKSQNAPWTQPWKQCTEPSFQQACFSLRPDRQRQKSV